MSFTHDSQVRCPRCVHRWQPTNIDPVELHADGHAWVRCPVCEHQFPVHAQVRITYVSPALLPGAKEE